MILRYGSARYPTRNKNGMLQVQSPNMGTWGDKWVTVARTNTWEFIDGVACGVGPVFVFKRVNVKNSYLLKAISYKHGGKLWSKYASSEPEIMKPGPYGVSFRIGRYYYGTHYSRINGPFNHP